MEEENISWLESLDQHMMTIYLAALLLSIFVCILDSSNELKKISTKDKIYGRLKYIFHIFLPFAVLPTMLVFVELIYQELDVILWAFVTEIDYGRKVWFSVWMFTDVFVALLIINLHSILNITLTTFGKLIYKAFLVKAAFHVITYIQLETFGGVEQLSHLYHLAIPTINIGIGIVLIINSISLRRENVVYGNAV